MSVHTLSQNDHLIKKDKDKNQEDKASSHLSSYLSHVSQIKSREAIKKPISEFKPTRHGTGAYWRKKCERCEAMDCEHMIHYDDEDVEYQQYLQEAVKNSLDTYCDQEMTRQICQMIVTSPQKPSRKGQYELSRSYQLTNDSSSTPVLMNYLKRSTSESPKPSDSRKRIKTATQ